MTSRTIRLAALAGAAATSVAVLGAALDADATPVAAAPNASAMVDTFGMHYTGLSGANVVTVKTSGVRFVVTDTAPITAGAASSAPRRRRAPGRTSGSSSRPVPATTSSPTSARHRCRPTAGWATTS
jgi:hypothetical protein